MKKLATTIFSRLLALMVSAVFVLGCINPSVPGSPGVPEPIKVLENPSTGERARFFREIWFKRPAGYNENKHIAEWTAARRKEGFTKEISPIDDRAALAELRARNLKKFRPAK